MKKIKQKWNKLQLNHKVVTMLVFAITIPSIILITTIFEIMRMNTINQELQSLSYEIDKQFLEIEKNIITMETIENFFINNKDLIEFLIQAEHSKVTTKDSINFYQDTIHTLEQIINSNQSLYQVRLYIPHKNIQEMMPILYHQDRIQNMSWDKEIDGWHFGYEDNLFINSSQNELIMSNVTKIYPEENNNHIAIMEVAMTMETMFNSIYNAGKNECGFFIDNKNNVYSNKCENMIEYIANDIKSLREKSIFYKSYNGDSFIIGYLPLNNLNGKLIITKNITSQINILISIGLCLVILIIILVFAITTIFKKVTNRLFNKFYEILYSIHEIQRGDLSIVIEKSGDDEINDLGEQINKLSNQIKNLVEENVNREILIKNSEIKALQNQINAHFIYNVLESIKMMAEIEEHYEISDAITALGKLLRYTIKWTNINVTIQEEIEYIKNYMILINLRFDYEISLNISIDDFVGKQLIPKMSLQPIVENSLYHGIEELAEETTIYITGVANETALYIEIMDTGRGMDSEAITRLYQKINGEIESAGGAGNGIGLKNVQDRIRMCFGDEYNLVITSKKDEFTKVRMYLPITQK
ncbi:hypothetical protein AN641_02380 [Candidatus Epulonipiscioides gigas]|nr:hypothetical protein AN641_02380 [Epulopiscium sp. SCG-C07WGA-EpuloA2]